jgi:hypothetical protein
MAIGFIRALPVGALGDNRTGMVQTSWTKRLATLIWSDD